MMKRKLFMKEIIWILMGMGFLLFGAFLWLISPMPQPREDVLSNQNYYIALKCTPKVRHKTIRVLCIESLHLKNDWRLC